MTKDYLFADVESHNAGKQYGMAPHRFVRLFQFAWNDGPVELKEVHTEEDLEWVRNTIRRADYVVFHNGVAFDMSVIFGKDSIEPLQMALDKKIIDTFVMASLVNPAPYKYINKDGREVFDAAKPERAMKWLSLDEQAHQLGVPGKMGNLKELAKKYQPEGTKVADYDYSLIPLDDEEFLAYARQDVIATRHIFKALLEMQRQQKYSGEYIWREMIVNSINAQISRNGVLVNTTEAQARVDELAREREEIMDWLVRDFDMPTNSKQPWKTNAGKGAIIKSFESFGIVPEGNDTWTRTASGAPSFSGETMLAISEGTEAEKLGRGLATLQGQRSLAQLALDSTYEDGRIHPDISCLQRSGRTSVQRPGLTVWTARGPGAVEKRYMIADPGTKMVEMDYSAADARAVAAVSGDEEFAKRFAPGVDAHDLTGEIFFGNDRYYADRTNLRQIAKIGGHSLAYRVGARKLAASVGVTVAEAAEYIDNYKKAYPWVTMWQETVTREGDKGSVTNWWGRKMTVDPDRSFNQSAALIGQSSTREILFDGLIRIAYDNIELIRWVRMTVHDAVVICVPEKDLDWGVTYFQEKMSMTFDPDTNVSQPVDFTLSTGKPADDWYMASHA